MSRYTMKNESFVKYYLPVQIDGNEAARKFRARFASGQDYDNYPKCAKCGSAIELMIDLYQEFDGSTLYWCHLGKQPDHIVVLPEVEEQVDE